MLLDLPNGDWVDPKIVTSVRYIAREKSYVPDAPDHPDRVVIIGTDNLCIVLPFDSPEKAKAMCLSIAQQINIYN